MDHYEVIGLMSGTSLDGLDIAHCSFSQENGRWTFELLNTQTLSYADGWKERLSEARNMKNGELEVLDVEYGDLLGQSVQQFIATNNIQVDFIASHGHTVFHDPTSRTTLQLGNAKSINEACGLPVINDFRSANVREGGQGAPLVPMGDLLLFPDHRYCLNLGGIANISDQMSGDISAFDICICNTALNFFAATVGQAYDKDGEIGRAGQVNKRLLEQLNALEYYRHEKPKSLDSSYFYHPLLPILENSGLTIRDQAATYYRHIADQVRNSVRGEEHVLLSGGGAHNRFLTELLTESGIQVVLPEKDIIDFKEALVFAFLGVLRLRGEVNCLQSVCGGPGDMSLGEMYGF